jgi:antitoxin component YwqK of YwqJK toxin-antitoxin module
MDRVLERELEYSDVDGLYYLGGQPFTGMSFTLSKAGWEKSTREYRDGLLWGGTREWYSPGVPMVESNFLKGALHGRAREWHKNGILAEDGEYEFGIAKWKKRWDQAGKLTEDYRLSEDSDSYQRLLKFRDAYGPA